MPTVDWAVAPDGRFIGGPHELVNIHSESNCAGEYCSIHNPSPHAMINWETVWDDQKKALFRLCPKCGLLLIDPDQLTFYIATGQVRNIGVLPIDCEHSLQYKDVRARNIEARRDSQDDRSS